MPIIIKVRTAQMSRKLVGRWHMHLREDVDPEKCYLARRYTAEVNRPQRIAPSETIPV